MKRQTPQMNMLKTFAALPSLFVAGALLSACAGKPNYIACPDISAPQEGTKKQGLLEAEPGAEG